MGNRGKRGWGATPELTLSNSFSFGRTKHLEREGDNSLTCLGNTEKGKNSIILREGEVRSSSNEGRRYFVGKGGSYEKWGDRGKGLPSGKGCSIFLKKREIPLGKNVYKEVRRGGPEEERRKNLRRRKASRVPEKGGEQGDSAILHRGGGGKHPKEGGCSERPPLTKKSFVWGVKEEDC